MSSTLKKLAPDTGFLRKNWQIIYAIILIILVPISIVLNTLFVVNRFRTTIDVELQRTAMVIGKMFNIATSDRLDDQNSLQQTINKVAEVVPEVKSLDILSKEDEDFIVFASLSPESIGRPAHGRQNILSWYDRQSIAYLTKSPRSSASDQALTAEEARSTKRYWGVVMPVLNTEGEIKYLLSAKISLEVMDNLVRDNLFWSYAWLSVTVLIIILVLASNTRLFQYAILFRKLKEVDKMKDDFISMASHELRAPITAIKGYLSLFLDEAYGKLEEKPKKVMTTTFSIAMHLGSLVEDLLDVSRIDQGRMKFDFEVMGVEDLIEEIMNQLSFEAERKGLTMTYKRPESPLPPVKIDKARIKQVLINITSNAIKYTPSGSVTFTTLIDDAGKLEIKVTDTGLGMSPEQREKLFTKFYRVKTDLTRDIQGTGLGLWITKQIVELMNGKIFVDSIEKVGTQVSVILPLAEKKINKNDEKAEDEPTVESDKSGIKADDSGSKS